MSNYLCLVEETRLELGNKRLARQIQRVTPSLIPNSRVSIPPSGAITMTVIMKDSDGEEGVLRRVQVEGEVEVEVDGRW